MSGYKISYNQDYTSISVLSQSGYRLYSITSVDKIDEIYSKENEDLRIVERLFNSSLVVLVTESKPNCLKMLHFKKKLDICNCVYPSVILCIRMNRNRLIVCLADSIHIHDIRDMKLLRSIGNIAPNELGLCTLSLNSHLAYPVSATSGELRIYNAAKLKYGITIKAHETSLSAMSFSSSGLLIATASERGTVIRVFCVSNGQRVQEFRRGMKRCVRIASLVFSLGAEFLCASSNTETVHIFKIDQNAVEQTERKAVRDSSQDVGSLSCENMNEAQPVESTGSWSGYLSNAVSTYLTSQVCDVLNQDRAFATATLTQPGLKHVCGLAKIQKELKLMVACEDGFLYIYDFSDAKGGSCKLERVHDLRSPLEGVTELNLTESMNNTSTQQAVVIESPEKKKDNSYAAILRGEDPNELTDSAKYRSLCDAIDSPSKIYDEIQFPPVAPARD